MRNVNQCPCELVDELSHPGVEVGGTRLVAQRRLDEVLEGFPERYEVCAKRGNPSEELECHCGAGFELAIV
jgi:hypothetical protein